MRCDRVFLSLLTFLTPGRAEFGVKIVSKQKPPSCGRPPTALRWKLLDSGAEQQI